MPEERPNYTNTSQTVVVEADRFSFETLEQENGHATVIRFRVENPRIRVGDMLVVLSGTDVCFHGMIGHIEEGYAIAADRRGSLLPASTVH
ncbi:MAG: hypothetical protein C4334_06070 [Pyrinomonas sp.]|uniref:hypothetical protein n=1 Tax=Pyrinomonas sp. TaxID=2080306 RepID=UPI00331724CD